MRKIYLTVALLSCLSFSLKAQSITDLADKVVDMFSGTIQAEDTSAYPISWVIAPLLAYSPETSVQLGMGSVILFKTKNALPADRTSSLFFSARYTLNQQITASPTYAIFSRGEKYIQKGKIDFRKFPQLYYGIGNNTAESNEELYGINTLSIEHLTYRNVVDKLYAGVGIRFKRAYNQDFKDRGLLASELPLGSKAYTAAGLNFGLQYDNRNNLMSTSTGMLAEFKYQVHYKALGSDYNYSLTKLDIRSYARPFTERKDILAWQVYAYLSEGEVPFNELAPLGGDMIMRGYYQGRYLHEKLVAAQVEYRMQIWKKISAVAFSGVGDVAHQWESFRWKDLKYSLGGGVRYSVLPDESLNVRFDYAFGKDTQNFYINISEAF
ncbi:BamA/TamA family outer membrane protein [Porifericola rhodea]|uniref:BamA/TamA family outer membrane protein n=1 Tax=Porifericola rhodea TaxID=930972 RepID=UPI0026655089|nr:BamA/TamA family outer membrane protein [Porifericola rhodea]WKN33071.1 BamA/TamA family outer membrane protein [Porifericola rhodea]